MEMRVGLDPGTKKKDNGGKCSNICYLVSSTIPMLTS